MRSESFEHIGIYIRTEDVHGNVQKDRSLTVFLCYVESLLQVEAKPAGVSDPYSIFRYGLNDGNDVRFLKASLPYTEVALGFECVYLARDEQGRSRVEVSVADACNKVCRTGTGRRVSNTDLACSLSIAASREGRALLVISNVGTYRRLA